MKVRSRHLCFSQVSRFLNPLFSVLPGEVSWYGAGGRDIYSNNRPMVSLNNRPMATLMLAVATCAIRLQACSGRLPNDLASFVKDGDRLASAEKHVHGTMMNINWKDGALPGSADGWHSSDGLGAERSGGVGLDGGGLSMRAYDRNGALAKLKDEKAAAHKWKRKAQYYKDALKRGQVGDQDGDSITKCDDKGCWSIDASDPATRATLQAFHAAAGSSQVIKDSMSGLAIAANAAVEAKTNELQSSRETEKPGTQFSCFTGTNVQ